MSSKSNPASSKAARPSTFSKLLQGLKSSFTLAIQTLPCLVLGDGGGVDEICMECESPELPCVFAPKEALALEESEKNKHSPKNCNDSRDIGSSICSLNKCSCTDNICQMDNPPEQLVSKKLSLNLSRDKSDHSSSFKFSSTRAADLESDGTSASGIFSQEETNTQSSSSMLDAKANPEKLESDAYSAYVFNSSSITSTSIVSQGHYEDVAPAKDARPAVVKPSDLNSHQYFAGELEECQSLDRRTQSTPPAIVDSTVSQGDRGYSSVLSNDSQISSAVKNDVPDDEDTEECITLETRYHLHSKATELAPGLLPSLPIPPRTVPSPSTTRTASSDQTIEHHAPEQKSFIDYTRYLMGLDFKAEMNPGGDPLEDAWTVATKRRGVYNLVQVPLKLERLLSFVMFICADEFLSSFTFLPLRALFAVSKLLLFILLLPLRLFRRRPSMNQQQRSAQHLRSKAHIANVIDVLHFSILVFTSAFLSLFDISWVYHNIRGQSVIKLYVVFNVMEIFDRLCSSFGVDILDSLGWTTASAVGFISRGSSPAQTGGATTARAVQSVWLLSRVAFDYLFALVYTCVHATMLLVWVVTLNVAINTKNNALITLLIANNFVELKGSVFKSYKIQNMFQIACSDGVERFQLAVFLAIMLVYTTGRSTLLVTWATIFSCEVLVDWIKHAFATKFNRISHRVYPQFSMVICHDIAQTRTHSVVRSVGGSAVAKRIGFVSLPLGALATRMATGSVRSLPLPAIGIIFLIMVTTKVALSIGLMGHAQRRLKRAAEHHSELPKEEDELESKWYQSLVNVGRYDLISKS